MDLRDAEEHVEAMMNRPCKTHGYEHREFGDRVVNILFFSCEYPEFETVEKSVYRYKLWVNGEPMGGGVI